MREHGHWSIGLGRWGDVQVRLHIFFLLFLAGALYLSWLAGQTGGAPGLAWVALLSVLLVMLSVALHVAGHVYAAAQWGLDDGEPVVVGPLGDFAAPPGPNDPAGALVIALAGPAMNLLVALATLPALLAAEVANPWRLLNPLLPGDLAAGPLWLVALKLALWINWTLAVVNLIPAYPLDGGRIVHALVRWQRPGISARRAARIVGRVGLIAAVLLVLGAWLVHNAGAGQLAPPWLVLLVLGIVVFFSSQQEPAARSPLASPDDDVFGYDFSQGYTSLRRSERELEEADEAHESGPLERWLDTRREARRQRQQQLEAEEDARVDEILARVHERGMHSLSSEERALLQRVAQRYRARQRE